MSLSLESGEPVPSQVKIDVDGTTVDVYSSALSDAGTYNVIVTATFNDYSVTTNSDVRFTLVKKCRYVDSITTPENPAEILYIIGRDTVPVLIEDYITTSVDCNFSWFLDLALNNGAAMPTFLNLNEDGRTVDVFGTDIEERGNYDIVVTATFDNALETTNSDVTFRVVAIQCSFVESHTAPENPVQVEYIIGTTLIAVTIGDYLTTREECDF